MSVSAEVRLQVRVCANFCCEYCGVSEINSGGELNIDHYHPPIRGGTDALENLVYSCQRCNLYKGDYWPSAPGQIPLWNPRKDLFDSQFLLLSNGRLSALTASAEFSIYILRLNRPQLIGYRIRQQAIEHERILLEGVCRAFDTLHNLLKQHVEVQEDQRQLLNEQLVTLKALLKQLQ